MSKIGQAKSLINSLKEVEIPSVQGGGTGNIFFDSLITDVQNRYAINNSLDSIKNSITQVTANINSVSNIANNLKEKYLTSANRLNELEEELTNLRYKYLEKQIKA